MDDLLPRPDEADVDESPAPASPPGDEDCPDEEDDGDDGEAPPLGGAALATRTATLVPRARRFARSVTAPALPRASPDEEDEGEEDEAHAPFRPSGTGPATTLDGPTMLRRTPRVESAPPGSPPATANAFDMLACVCCYPRAVL